MNPRSWRQNMRQPLRKTEIRLVRCFSGRSKPLAGQSFCSQPQQCRLRHARLTDRQQRSFVFAINLRQLSNGLDKDAVAFGSSCFRT